MARKPYSKSIKNPEVRAVFEKMVEEGVHYEEIAETLGYSTAMIFKYLKEYPDYSYKRRIDPDVMRRNQAKGIEVRQKRVAEGGTWFKTAETPEGRFGPEKKPGEYSTNHRYINGWVPRDHPLAKIAGQCTVHQHRITLFEKIGGGKQQCHWCRRDLWWKDRAEDSVEVDHLNFDTHDNRPENLLPACMSCNRSRNKRKDEKIKEAREIVARNG